VKRTLIASALLAASTSAFAYSAGSLAFISYNGDRDGVSLVALTDIAPNSVFFLRDDEWNGTNWNDDAESTIRWNSGATTIQAGRVISFAVGTGVSLDTVPGGPFGTVSYVDNSNTGYNNDNETVYLYTTSTGVYNTGTPTFIAAVSISNFGANGSLTGTGLTAGVNATAAPSSADFTQYTGARVGLASFSSYLPLIANSSNWFNGGSGVFTTTLPDQTNFAPIPEPTETALMLSALGIIGAIARRRRQAK
jgi:hypothetical protein